jgi:hypothetical protein
MASEPSLLSSFLFLSNKQLYSLIKRPFYLTKTGTCSNITTEPPSRRPKITTVPLKFCKYSSGLGTRDTQQQPQGQLCDFRYKRHISYILKSGLASYT